LTSNSLLNKCLKTTRFFTSTSLFLALNSLFVACFSFFLYDIAISPTILLAVFLSTFGVYGLNKVTDSVEDAINKPESSQKGSHYIIPSIVCYLISLGIGLFEGLFVFAVLLTPLIIGVVYSVKVCKSVPRLKEVLGLKSILVAFSWAFTGSLLPALMSVVDIEKIILIFIYIFIQLFVNTILFDVIDMKGDKVSGVRTIPIFLGCVGTMYLLLGVNSLLLFLIGYCLFIGLFVSCLPALIFGVFYSYVLIWYFTQRNGKRFGAELVVDGEWLPIVMILRVLIK